MKPRHLLTSLVAIAATAMLLAACGGGDNNNDSSASSKGASSGSGAGATSNAVKISNFKFVPGTVTVKRGAAVAVTNDDSTAHTATADNGTSFDTGTLDPGLRRRSA